MSRFFLRLVMLSALGLSAWAEDGFKLSVQQQKSLGIQTAPLGSFSGVVRTGWPAQVEVSAGRLRMVVAPVSGLVTQLNKAPGDRVKAGQTLALLSSTELLAEQRGLMMAGARLKVAREKAARDEKLFAEGIIAESRLRSAQAELTQAEAEYNAQRATLRAYGLGTGSISRIGGGKLNASLPVAAPLDGVVLEQPATVGQRVDAGGPLYKVADLSRLVLDIKVPADRARRISIGQAVSVTGSQAAGKVTSIGALVGSAQTLSVRAEIRDPQNMLRPGQQLEAQLGSLPSTGQWEVPTRALVWQRGRPYLFVAVGQGFKAEPVSLVSHASDHAFVSGALNGKEQIAVAGLASLKAIWQGGGE
ncbi:MAG: efflux RND transporter periplasmic adaptor subunit [Thiobacillaceae bacterium]|jgi:cobalt-zinc-cadmium efflux system membrane fusion protein